MDVQNETDVLLELELDGVADEPARIDGIVLGKVTGVSSGGWPLVNYDQNPEGTPLMAAATVKVTEADVNRPVALQFLEGDPRQPVILGFLWTPGGSVPEKGLTLSKDEERLELSAKQEIVLRCGKSSITLTKAGKVIIRGKYLLSRSSGVNRIKGGSVQIN